LLLYCLAQLLLLLLGNLKLFPKFLSLGDNFFLLFFHPNIFLLDVLYSLSSSYSYCLSLSTLLYFSVGKFCHLTALLLKHLYQRGLQHLVIRELARRISVVSSRVLVILRLLEQRAHRSYWRQEALDGSLARKKELLSWSHTH